MTATIDEATVGSARPAAPAAPPPPARGHGPWRRRVALVLVVAAAVAVVVVVGTRPRTAEADDRRERATEILDHASGTGQVPEASSALREQVATEDGLRVGLRTLLGRHVATVARTMEGAVTGAPDLEADARSLRGNSQALAAAVALAYGDVGGRAFDELWSQHARLLVAYGSAVGTGRDADAAAAREGLEHYHADFTSFCSLATGLPAPTVEQLVGAHLDRLLAYADAVAAGERVEASEVLGRALTEMVPIADALTGAIVEAADGDLPGTWDGAEAERVAAATSAVQRTTTLLVEGVRSGVDPRLQPTVATPGPELAAAWADLVGAAGGDDPVRSDALARAAEADGVADDRAAALVAAVDDWLGALDAHAAAVADGRGPASTDAAAAAERAAVAIGVAFADLDAG